MIYELLSLLLHCTTRDVFKDFIFQIHYVWAGWSWKVHQEDLRSHFDWDGIGAVVEQRYPDGEKIEMPSDWKLRVQNSALCVASVEQSERK